MRSGSPVLTVWRRAWISVGGGAVDHARHQRQRNVQGSSQTRTRRRVTGQVATMYTVYRRDPDLDTAERALREAVAVDLGDHFRFALTPGRRLIQDGVASTISVVAYRGYAEFARFHVDLVARIQMTAAPDDVPPLVSLEVPGLSCGGYRAYPVPDHIVDKVCAIFEVHEQGGRPVQVRTCNSKRTKLRESVPARTAMGAPELAPALAACRCRRSRSTDRPGSLRGGASR
jgi:hypothetical protein